MAPCLDVYRTTDEGTEWIGCFLGIDAAQARVMELAEGAPGHYTIYDQATGERCFYQLFSRE
jgi:hypothetical protein